MNEKESKRMCMFFCSNCLAREQVEDISSQFGLDRTRVISLPCSGKITIPYLMKAFESGAEAVVILTCQVDDCQRIEGNKRAKKRAQAVDSMLDEIGMGAGRIAVIEANKNKHEETIDLFKEFYERVKSTPVGSVVQAAR